MTSQSSAKVICVRTNVPDQSSHRVRVLMWLARGSSSISGPSIKLQAIVTLNSASSTGCSGIDGTGAIPRRSMKTFCAHTVVRRHSSGCTRSRYSLTPGRQVGSQQCSNSKGAVDSAQYRTSLPTRGGWSAAPAMTLDTLGHRAVHC